MDISHNEPPATLKIQGNALVWICLWLLVLPIVFLTLFVWSSGPELTTFLARILANNANRTDLSRQILDVSSLIWPTSASLRNAFGQSVYQAGEKELAIKEFRRAIKLDPALAVARNNLGVALLQQGKPQEALNNFNSALALDPGNAQIYLNLAAANKVLGQNQQALDNLLQAANFDTDTPTTWAQIGDLALNDNQLPLAQQAFLKALSYDPADQQSLFGMGIVAYQQNRTVDAITYFNSANSLKPNQAIIHFYSGLAYERLGQLERAEAELQQAMSLSSNPNLTTQIMNALTNLSQECSDHNCTSIKTGESGGAIQKP